MTIQMKATEQYFHLVLFIMLYNVVVSVMLLCSVIKLTCADAFLFLCFLGSVEALLANLSSPNEEVRSSAAVALGYLSFDRTASRLMLQACRNTPGLLESLVDNLGNGKISMEFMDEWRQTKMVGLPSARYIVTAYLVLIYPIRITSS